MSSATKKKRQPKAGDRIRDNDPRMGPRVLTIKRVDASYVYAVNASGRESRHLRGTVHTDGKPRRSGFSLVESSS